MRFSLLSMAQVTLAASVLSHSPRSSPVMRRDADPIDFNWSKVGVVFDEPLQGGDISGELGVSCIECQANAVITPDWDLDFIIEDSTVSLTFSDTSAYFDFDITASGDGTYTYNIFTSETPLGIAIGDDSIGLVFYIDLVFHLSADVDVTGGFKFSIADGATIEFDLNGNIKSQVFDGITTQTIPWQIQSGSATLTVDLQLRAELGGSFGIAGFGADAEAGLYLNLMEIVATLDSTDTCALETTEFWDINAAAYVDLDAVVDSSTIGFTPTYSTTFYTGSTWSSCWETVETTAPITTDVADPTSTEVFVTPTETASFFTTPEAVETATDTPIFISTPEPVVTATDTPIFTSVSETAEEISTFETAVQTTFSSATRVKPTMTNFANSTITSAPVMHTSTVFTTTVYTITSCAASVINCPADWQKEYIITKTVDLYTTVCPVGEEQTTPAPITKPHRTIDITGGVMLQACPTPIIGTFSAPPESEKPVEHVQTIHMTQHGPTQTTAVVTETETSTTVAVFTPEVTTSAESVPTTSAVVTAGASGQEVRGIFIGFFALAVVFFQAI